MADNLVVSSGSEKIQPSIPLEQRSFNQRIARRLRSIYLSKMLRRFASVGVGFSCEPLVHFEGTKNIAIEDYVKFLRGSVILAHEGQVRFSSGSTVCRYAVLETAGGFIHIGEGSVIGDYTSLYGQGGLTIGKHVQIASGCRIVPKTTSFDNKELLIGEDGYEAKGITIQDNVWLGVNCVILDGVTIGTGAVVGAGAVVTKSIPKNGVAMGVPAKVVRFR